MTLMITTKPVEEAQQGYRIDKWLALELSEFSRSRLQNLLEEGHVWLDGQRVQDSSKKVKSGQIFAILIPENANAAPQGEEIPLVVVYEDKDLIVIDKPAGMVVHPAPGNSDGTLVNALISHCSDSLSGIGGVKRPGIVHRIDKDTSGLLVVAKNDAAHHGLARQFAAHDLERAYKAIVWGSPSPKEGRIEGNIGRSPSNRKKMAIVKEGGKAAITNYKTLKSWLGIASLVECRLLTGRTHQIRVHMTSLGYPLLGDGLYGRVPALAKRAAMEVRQKLAAFPRQALHAYLLGFRHPISGIPLSFSSNLPNDFKDLEKLLDEM